jgi:hypothetical protein
VARALLSHADVAAFLDAVPPLHREREVLGLARSARRLIEAEQREVARVWESVTSSSDHARWSQVDRDLFHTVIAQAAEEGQPGGRQLLLSYALAAIMAEQLTGREREPMALWRAARRIGERGVWVAKRSSGGCRATEYTVLPVIKTPSGGCLYNREPVPPLPGWSPQDRAVFHWAVQELAVTHELGAVRDAYRLRFRRQR